MTSTGMGSYRVIAAVEAVGLTLEINVEDNGSGHQDHGLVLVRESKQKISQLTENLQLF